MEWGIVCGTCLSVLLNASCHKKHEYIRFMGGDLNDYKGIKLFLKINMVGACLGTLGVLS